MEKQYRIRDEQLGEFTEFTTLDEILNYCLEDYMGNDWTEKEAEEIEKEFAAMSDKDKMSWVETYGYAFYAPGTIIEEDE